MKRTKLFLVIGVVAVVAAGALVAPNYIKPVDANAKTGIATSGFIEAKKVNVVPEAGGRITEISVEEGDTVNAGDIVVTFDSALLIAQRRQAEANLNLVQANVAEATLARDTAEKAWENARDVQLKTAQVTLEQANNSLNKITYPYTYSTFAFDVPAAVTAINDAQRQLADAHAILAGGPSAENYTQALQQFRDAQDNLTKAQERLLRGQGADVIINHRLSISDYFTLRAVQLDAEKAELAVQGATTAVDQAHTAYLRAENAIKVAGVQVDQAVAALNIIDVQAGKMKVSAPISGVVTAKNIEVGEMASAGAPVLTVTAIDNVNLTVYVPESQIGLVKLGQKAQVAVDPYPGAVFTGNVTYISPDAVFTPNNIQLKDEREKMVFAVKINLANPDQKLKSGMPADATIITDSQS